PLPASTTATSSKGMSQPALPSPRFVRGKPRALIAAGVPRPKPKPKVKPLSRRRVKMAHYPYSLPQQTTKRSETQRSTLQEQLGTHADPEVSRLAQSGLNEDLVALYGLHDRLLELGYAPDSDEMRHILMMLADATNGAHQNEYVGNHQDWDSFTQS